MSSREVTYTCAVLDDYQGVALRLADWSALPGGVEVRVLREHIAAYVAGAPIGERLLTPPSSR